MCVFYHYGPVVKGWDLGNSSSRRQETAVFVIYQVKVISLPGIVPEPEVTNKNIVPVIQLYESTDR